MKNFSNSIPHHETVEIAAQSQLPGQKWMPIIGPETLSFLEHLKSLEISEGDRENVRNESKSVLANCVSPHVSSGTETGLVVGYVQSGKTMSFTAVAALARDNDYRLIIIITGTSVPLFEQSTERLKEDLRLIKRKDRLWQFFANPKNRPEVKQRIASALESDENLAGIGKIKAH